ncbi:MAG: flagellar biosynthesis anti-sigma factor FlgM [Planctomycetota bacterium]
MSDVSSISFRSGSLESAGRAAESRATGGADAAPARDAAPRTPAAPIAPTGRSEDSVEVSDVGYFLAKARESDGIRRDVVDRVRNELARGVYDVDAKLDRAADALIDAEIDDLFA